MRYLVLVVFIALAACGLHASGPRNYDTGALGIVPQEIELSRDKLELKFTFINHTDKVMNVDRAQLRVRLTDGTVIARDTGTFGGLTSSSHTIAPGMSHDVFVDFIVGDVEPGEIALVLSGVVVDGKPLTLPDYIITLTDS